MSNLIQFLKTNSPWIYVVSVQGIVHSILYLTSYIRLIDIYNIYGKDNL